MIAAYFAKLNNKNSEVCIFEKNSYLGAKVIISGGGRCNVTTGLQDVNEILKRYPRGSRFLRFAMHEFSSVAVMDFFEKDGVALKVEKDLRVFPVSNSGKDVVKVFESFFEKNNVKTLYNSNVLKIEKVANTFFIHTKDKILEFDKVVLTTGGQAYRQTGSTGDGYAFAKSLGHNITDLAPSLGSFVLKEDFVKSIAGVSFDKVSLRLKGNIKEYAFQGPILFTHKGLTGPAVFALSALAAYEKYNNQNPIKLYVDFFPYKKHEELLSLLNDFIIQNMNKLFVHVLDFVFPKSFAHLLSDLLKVENKKSSEISKKDINKCIELIKNFEVNIVGIGVGEEFVTAGGVDLKEVDDKTMESKVCKNLYFAGEILDIDGFTGGFNLQAAWATGRLVGVNL